MKQILSDVTFAIISPGSPKTKRALKHEGDLLISITPNLGNWAIPVSGSTLAFYSD